MKRFTDAIRKTIQNKNWYAGLFLALCLPDICGSLETPKVSASKRYKRWFDNNLSEKYSPMFSSEDCYYFRCSCLHQGFDKHNKLVGGKVNFIPPPPNNNIIHLNKLNDILQMQIDIFCNDMSNATDEWYKKEIRNNPKIQLRMKNLIKIDMKPLHPFISFG